MFESSVRFDDTASEFHRLFHIRAALAASGDTARKRARERILEWLRVRFGTSLSPHDVPSEISNGAFDLAVMQDGSDWRLRLKHPDRQFPARSWCVDIAIGGRATARFDLKLYATLPSGAPSLVPSPPAFLQSILSSPGLIDRGIALSPAPRLVASPEDVDDLVALLLSPARRRPVYVVSAPKGPAESAALPIDTNLLHKRCLGLAHVVLLLPQAALRLTAGLGAGFSVWNGAVRTYRPGFNPQLDAPLKHPVAPAAVIRRAPGSFVRRLIYEACGESLGLGPRFSAVAPEAKPAPIRVTIPAARPIVAVPSSRPAAGEPGLETIPAWIDTELAGRLVLHPRAARAIKGAQFRDVRLVRNALDLLAGTWRDLKLGCVEDREEFGRKAALLGLRASQSLSQSQYGLERSAYVVEWHGTKHKLAHHLKNGGNTRDPERCLRIYYFWDASSHLVVVGHLPSHLPITVS